MTGTVMPMPVFQGWDDNGDPVPGGLLYTYSAGTTTALSTFSDAALAVANANPVVLSAAGRAVVFLSSTSYKFVLKTSAGVTLWTQDNVNAVPLASGNVDVDGTAGEALTANQAAYLSAGDGGLTAGRWYKADADNAYSSSTAKIVGFAVNAIAAGASGSIRVYGSMSGFAGLTAGTAYYVSATAGAITSSAPALARFVGAADTTTSLVLAPNPDDPSDASSTLAGLVNLSDQQLGTGIKTVGSKQPKALLENTTETINLGGLLTYDATDRAITGVSVLTDSGWTYSIDAAALKVGNEIVVRVSGTYAAANSVVRVVQVNFGGTGVDIIRMQTGDLGSSGDWVGEASILITGAATQRMDGIGRLSSGAIANTPDYVTAAVAISGAITLKTQLNPANAADTITQTKVTVKVF